MYALIGLVMWVFLLKSGVHATVGGVLLAITIPSKMRIDGAGFTGFARDAIGVFEKAGGSAHDILTNPRRQQAVQGLEVACEHVQTPLGRLEHRLHPWVAFLIMPIFALANAGIAIGAGFGTAVGSGVGLGIVIGLVVGKPVGILLATFAAVRLGLGDLPEGTNWKQIAAAGLLAGVGFTMSLFIANLAFRDSGMLQLAKAGILCGSLVAGVGGFLLLRASSPLPAGADEGE